jgi:hypothetical protein
MKSVQRYFITEGDRPEREVNVYQYVSMEARAGFHGPGHWATPPYPACASFGATKGEWNVRGRTEPLA